MLALLCGTTFGYGQTEALLEAKALFDKGEYIEAKNKYSSESILEDEKPYAAARIAVCNQCIKLHARADYLFSEKETQKALAKYQEILAVNPKDPLAKERINILQPPPDKTNSEPASKMSEVSVLPQYPGGNQKFIEYIMSRMGGVKVKDEPLRMQFKFVIEKDGRIGDIEILKDGDNPVVAGRVVRALVNSPKWNPGMKNGKPVRVSFVLPVTIAVPGK